MAHPFSNTRTAVGGPERILIIGADGTIGTRLLSHLRMRGKVALGTTRRQRLSNSIQLRHLDLAQIDSVRKLRLDDVDYAVFLAGITSISYCNENQDEAWKVNVHGSGKIVERLADRGIPCMLVSSSCVFHEKAVKLSESSARVPTSIYGRQKKELEDLVAQGAKNLIVRINKVWGMGSGLLNTWHQSLRNERPIEAFYDLRVAPIHIDSACRYMVNAISKTYKGVRHVSTDTQTNYSEVAEMLCLAMGVDPDKFVIPTSCLGDPNVIYRPERAFLGCEEPQSMILSLNEELSSIISDETGTRRIEW